MACALDSSLQKRAGYGLLYCLNGLVIALCVSDSDMSNALVGHNRLHISEVQINQTRNIDQVGDALYCLLQNLICLL